MSDDESVSGPVTTANYRQHIQQRLQAQGGGGGGAGGGTGAAAVAPLSLGPLSARGLSHGDDAASATDADLLPTPPNASGGVLEARYMEMARRNRDLTVRYNAETTRTAKLQARVVALERERLEAVALLPSQLPSQDKRGKGGGGATETDVEAEAAALRSQLATAQKSLALYRKQHDDGKREVSRLRGLLVREIGDDALAALVMRDDATNDGAASEVSVATTAAGGAGKGAGAAWRGRSEQIQVLKARVRTLQKQLAGAQNSHNNNNACGDDDGGTDTASTAAYTAHAPPTGRTTSVPRDRSGTPSASSVRTGVTNVDDMQERRLGQQAALKRRQQEETARRLAETEAALEKERARAEAMALRIKVMERDASNQKAALQTLFDKAANDDALIGTYKEELEALRAEGKSLRKAAADAELRQQQNDAAATVLLLSPTTQQSDQYSGNSGALGGGGRSQQQHKSFAEANQRQLRDMQAKLEAAEAERDGLRGQLAVLRQMRATGNDTTDEASTINKERAASRKSQAAGGAGSKARKQRPVDVDSDLEDAATTAASSSAQKASDEHVAHISKRVAERYAWLLSHVGAPSSSSSGAGDPHYSPTGYHHAGGNGTPTKGARHAIELATDLIQQQRLAIVAYEGKLQGLEERKGAQREREAAANIRGGVATTAAAGGPEAAATAREMAVLRDENKYLRDRIRTVTDMMNREIEVHKHTAASLYQPPKSTSSTTVAASHSAAAAAVQSSTTPRPAPRTTDDAPAHNSDDERDYALARAERFGQPAATSVVATASTSVHEKRPPKAVIPSSVTTATSRAGPAVVEPQSGFLPAIGMAKGSTPTAGAKEVASAPSPVPARASTAEVPKGNPAVGAAAALRRGTAEARPPVAGAVATRALKVSRSTASSRQTAPPPPPSAVTATPPATTATTAATSSTAPAVDGPRRLPPAMPISFGMQPMFRVMDSHAAGAEDAPAANSDDDDDETKAPPAADNRGVVGAARAGPPRDRLAAKGLPPNPVAASNTPAATNTFRTAPAGAAAMRSENRHFAIEDDADEDLSFSGGSGGARPSPPPNGPPPHSGNTRGAAVREDLLRPSAVGNGLQGAGGSYASVHRPQRSGSNQPTERARF